MSKSLQARWFKVCEKEAKCRDFPRNTKESRIAAHNFKMVRKSFAHGVCAEYGVKAVLVWTGTGCNIQQDYTYVRKFLYAEPLG